MERKLWEIYFILIKNWHSLLFLSKKTLFFPVPWIAKSITKWVKIIEANGGVNLKGKIINVDVFHSILNVEFILFYLFGIGEQGKKQETCKGLYVPLSQNIYFKKCSSLLLPLSIFLNKGYEVVVVVVVGFFPKQRGPPRHIFLSKCEMRWKILISRQEGQILTQS